MQELAPGRSLGGYTIEKLLGKGAMGAVYAATDAAGARVALKVMTPDAARDAPFIERFRREASAAQAVKHPNIARCLGAGEDAGVPFIALELVAGGSLDERVKRSGKLPWREAAALAAEVARALEAIHAHGLVHRDLKPANVLLDESGEVKLTDFGVARRAGAGTLTNTGEFLGTPEFMAPEQALAAKKVDGRADLYSLGVLLHCIVAGTPPFTGSVYSVLQKQATATPPRLAARVPEVPAALDALVARLLAKDPAARGEARSVAEELESISRVSQGGGSRVLIASLVVIALLLGLGAALLGRERRAPPVAVAPSAPSGEPAPSASAAESAAPSAPEWFRALPASERPALPLPAALRFGAKKGEYLLARDPSVVLVYVPAGSFEMGDPILATPVHTVELSAFFIGRTEVTNAQFRRFAATLADKLVCVDPRDRGHGQRLEGEWNWERPSGDWPLPLEGTHPVVQIAHEHALLYAKWAGGVLPTEAQWERAAAWDPVKRESQRFPWGDEVPSKDTKPLANLIDTCCYTVVGAQLVFAGYNDGYARTAPVGSFPADVSKSGLWDVTGNACEWCRDVWDEFYYERSPRRDPLCETPHFEGDKNHCVRGGSWGRHSGTVGVKSRDKADYSSNAIGLRLAVEGK